VAAEDASTRFATVVCVIVDATSGSASYATAGHPPPLLRSAQGPVTLLGDANGVPLGLRRGVARRDATIDLPVGALLMLYTDGLIERRGESIDEGLGRLCDVVAGERELASRQVVDRAVARLLQGRDHHDDVAILCAQLLPPGSLRYRLSGRADELVGARHALAAWLEGRLSPSDAEGLVLAVGEALANAVEHAHDGASGGAVDVTAWDEGDGIAVRVRDRGEWRGGGAVTPFGGRGLGIMEVLVDDVTIERGAPPLVSGTTVVLRRRSR
jgi:anti-sigma regulatory factor (Ser/Thr protein kinase)